MSKEIELTQGKVAIVDDEDYEWLNQWKWCYHKSYNGGYAERTDYKNGVQKTIKMHREIMNATKGQQIDHKNLNRLDNTKENLRICNIQENSFNRKSKGVTSKYKGVSYSTNGNCKWRARIYCGDKRIHIGYYDNEIDAAKAYNEEAIKLFGEFAWLNEIPEDHVCHS